MSAQNERIAAVRLLLESIEGDDAQREGLKDTPMRFLRALDFLTSGYSDHPNAVLKCFEDGAQGFDEMVFQRDIPFYSLCEHHISPFFGAVHIGYVPNGKIVGLSKLARLVDIYSRRLQVQERLCCQIADTLMRGLQAKGVGVVIQARHLCMESRGVQKSGTVTVTNALRGVFRDLPDARAEFMSLVQTAMQGGKGI